MDLNGKSEIVTGPGAGGSPNVRVFNGGNATLLSSFFAFDQQFLGGVTVGLTDVNYDGFEDIVAAAGPGERLKLAFGIAHPQNLVLFRL